MEETIHVVSGCARKRMVAKSPSCTFSLTPSYLMFAVSLTAWAQKYVPPFDRRLRHKCVPSSWKIHRTFHSGGQCPYVPTVRKVRLRQFPATIVRRCWTPVQGDFYLRPRRTISTLFWTNEQPQIIIIIKLDPASTHLFRPSGSLALLYGTQASQDAHLHLQHATVKTLYNHGTVPLHAICNPTLSYRRTQRLQPAPCGHAQPDYLP